MNRSIGSPGEEIAVTAKRSFSSSQTLKTIYNFGSLPGFHLMLQPALGF